MNSLNGSEIEGRRIRLSYAASRGGSSRDPRRNDRHESSRTSFHESSGSSSRYKESNDASAPQSFGNSGWGTEPDTMGSSRPVGFSPMKTESGWGEPAEMAASPTISNSGWGASGGETVSSGGWGESNGPSAQNSEPQAWGMASSSDNKRYGGYNSRTSDRGESQHASHEEESSTLFIGSLGYECSEDIIREHFAPYGTIVGIRMSKDRDTGKFKG